MAKEKKGGNYTVEKLIKIFRAAAKFRNACTAQEWDDNAGPIHSAERALDLICQRVPFKRTVYLSSYKNHPEAIFSKKALVAYEAGETLKTEHIAPRREFTRHAIDQIEKWNDEQFVAFLKEHFSIVLLTPEEVKKVDENNRSRFEPGRLEAVGIELAAATEVLSARMRMAEKKPHPKATPNKR